jgi:hypothetical protein
MTGDGLAAATRFLVLALSVLYVLAAIAGLALVNFDSAAQVAAWTVPLLAGAGFLAAGQLLLPVGARSAALISVGAVLGGLPLFWTLLVPIAVAVVIACSVRLARRPPTTA